MKLYRPVSLILCLLFAIVGLLFLVIPDRVLEFFNTISGHLGMSPSPVEGHSFYVVLTAGYMYLVTLLAFLMYRNPENRQFPLILAHGKLASSVLSLGLFLIHEYYLIYITNFVVDGFIGIVVLFFYLKLKRRTT